MNKTILYVVNQLNFLISHRLDIVLATKKKGYNVKVAYGVSDKKSIEIFLENNIDCYPIKLNRKSKNLITNLFSLFSISLLFKKLRPDIVHLITIKPYLFGGIASRIVKVPCVVSAITGLGFLSYSKRNKNFFLKKILYFFLQLSFNHHNQKLIVQNSYDKKTIIKLNANNSKKISLLHGSGTNLSKFKNLIEPNKTITICFCSRLLHDKGVFDFINAAKILKKRAIKAKFLLAGNLDSDNTSSLSNKELQNIKKEKIVKVLGYHQNIPLLFARSNIICLPSYYGEGLPKVLIEAAAASRAVITTNIPGCRDAIIPNKTGLLVPLKNPKKLADAFEYLIKHPAKRIAMGKAGRKLAEKKFSIEKVVKAHLSIYQQLIKATNKKN
jgi:glycosyltransferase involved in cell wall biosynthesis